MSETCLHCHDPIPPQSEGGADFCCKGCDGAYHLIRGMGLNSYYDRRTLDPEIRSLKPDDENPFIDYQNHVQHDAETATLYLMVEGIHCAACVWLIETALGKQDGVIQARVNMTTRRLVLKWQVDHANANDLVAVINGLGYRLVPYDPQLIASENDKVEKELLRAMAVAGFAAANVMLFSISIWAGYTQGMQESTRDMMHWLSALITLPAVMYAGMPFYRSAFQAVRAGRTNMDIPISLAVLLAAGMSLVQVIESAKHAYFDSAVSLLFFLLIGRYLDRRARGKARGAAEQLLGLNAIAVTLILEDGTKKLVAPDQVQVGDLVFCVPGERIAIDGLVEEGRSDMDTSLISGETVPQEIAPGTRVYAGTTNLSGALKIRVDAVGEGTFLAEIVRLMEEAEAGRAKYVTLADRAARGYAPLVHILALGTFIFWFFYLDSDWHIALLNAIAVLIITCPCALALAVPVVQVIASGRLMRQGILMKTGTALERLAQVKTVVFDKTGTLTQGTPQLIHADQIDPQDMKWASQMAANSKHPLSRALVRATGDLGMMEGVREIPGRGLESADGMRLGARRWCGEETAPEADGPEMWLSKPDGTKVLFQFADTLRLDAPEIVQSLKDEGVQVHLLSGDRVMVVEQTAQKLGIDHWQAACSPKDKCAALEKLDTPLMVGDGLNDAPALAAAHVSLSPSSAIDVSQNTADCVFQGERLRPVLEVIRVSRKAEKLVQQNFALSFIYNIITVPLAVAGYVTPLIAAIAMSTSSLIVIGNALRLTRGK